ncbi:DUF6443 domain-containing protein [Chryseobacterium indologenes]|uniref:DUF6443 domain-containing protein n=1 Tax=Chryseobacterium indologenes TaxID=253 RepID=UPI00076E3E07|nr:DUF6443 domain-containing protein [Chryseobacterium indologenes]
MRKIITPIGILLATGVAKAQLSPLPNNENYIQSKTYLDYNGNTSSKSSETVQYFDGLGRPKQVVNVKSSPLGKDVVTHIEYDGFGRQVREYLPVPQPGTLNGGIVPLSLANATQPDIYGQEKIFAEKILENSPLDRVQQQIQVGNDWAGKPVKFNYDAITVADGVRKFVATTNMVNGTLQSVLSEDWLYRDKELYKNTITDEDGNKTTEFKNGKGKTVVVRKIVNGENADTHYVYNEYDQLAFVLPPLASIRGDIVANTVKHDELCYQYRYDGKNRLIEKKLPGKDWEYMVYDKADRLILTQDVNLRNQAQWLFTKYDQFGRIAYTGIMPGSTRAAMQDQIGNQVITETQTSIGFSKSGTIVYYTNAFLSNLTTLLSINYYDTYPRDSRKFPPAKILDQFVINADGASNSGISTLGLPTASYVKNIEDDKWTMNYMYYDTKGRVIGTYSFNHLGGYTQTESKLDFAGLVQNSEIKHLRKPDEAEVNIKERFEYDSQNRLLKHYHQVDFWPEQLLADNTYNELSQLKNKKVGNNLQNIDYAYNIRGWLTDINKGQMSVPDLGGKLFSYAIKYTQKNGLTNPDPVLFAGKDVQPKYNGNIAEVDWRTVESIGANPPLEPKRYGYAYDGLNRLTAGYYQNPNNPGSKENTESLSYDLNGNITGLYRTGVTDNSNTPTVIDNLTYTYTGNQAIQIKDNSNNKTGYEGISGFPIEYDLNGNMKSMMDKEITAINYNYLSLPNMVQIGFDPITTSIKTNYRADGLKLRKENTRTSIGFGGTTWTKEITDYLDGFQYLNKTSSGGNEEMFSSVPQETRYALEQQAFSLNDKVVAPDPGTGNGGIIKNPHHPELQFFPTAEGFYDYQKKMYIYQYKDHLGNVRISYGRSNYTGLLEITDVNDYYPFGMNHLKSGNAFFGAGTYKNYKYQGQELQETGFYSFKWRNYMPDVGRFFNIDPLSEKYAYQSHYNFAENRVIDGRELEGLEWVKSTTLNDNGTKTYTLSATINLVNRSQNLTPEGVEAFKTNFVSQMKESFGGTMNNGDKIEVGNINFTDKGSYTIALTDQISTEQSSKELDNGSEIKGYTFGENGNSQVNYMEAVVSGEMTSAYATHEIGHSLGLKHQDDKSNPISPKQIGTDNLMSTPQWKIAKQTIPEQKQIIIQNIPDEKNKN